MGIKCEPDCTCGRHIKSAETRAKISRSQTGRVVSEETRAKLSRAHAGHPVSEKTKRLISEAKMGHTVSEETRAKLAITSARNRRKCPPGCACARHRPFSDEHRRKISEGKRNRGVDK